MLFRSFVLLFCGISIVMGYFSRKRQLVAFETKRQTIVRGETDFLTNLYNRKKCFQSLAAWSKTGLKNHVGALILLDIDNFKLYNDTYGHQQGDQCLKQVSAKFLEFGARNNLTFYRYGGEEFVAVAPKGVTNPTELCQQLNREIYQLRIPHSASTMPYVTISIGVTVLDGQNQHMSYEQLLAQADQALYLAKANGRHNTICYNTYHKNTKVAKHLG